MSETTEVMLIIKSSLTGAMAGATIFPAEAIKKKLQSGQIKQIRDVTNLCKFSLTSSKFTNEQSKFRIPVPKVELYRGVVGYITCLSTVTCLQYSIHSFLQQQLKLNENEHLSLLSPALSGIVSATASTALENTLLRQQIHKIGPLSSVKSLFQQNKLRIFKGFTCIGMREAIFTSCYMMLSEKGASIARDILKSDSYLTSLLGMVLVGIVGTLTSHPFDTIATVAQKNEVTVRQAAKQIFKGTTNLKDFPKGVRGFYAGGASRFILFTSAMLVIPTYQKLLGF